MNIKRLISVRDGIHRRTALTVLISKTSAMESDKQTEYTTIELGFLLEISGFMFSLITLVNRQ